MGAANECPRCKRLAMTEGESRVAAMYNGICVECWRSEHPAELLPLPSLEFFPPSAVGDSRLFKEQMFKVWDSVDVSKLKWLTFGDP